jgi:putative SOS response-associated peptidase YedK
VRGPKSALVDGEHELFGFLMTEANAVVAPIHPKAMPAIPDGRERVEEKARERPGLLLRRLT